MRLTTRNDSFQLLPVCQSPEAATRRRLREEAAEHHSAKPAKSFYPFPRLGPVAAARTGVFVHVGPSQKLRTSADLQKLQES